MYHMPAPLADVQEKTYQVATTCQNSGRLTGRLEPHANLYECIDRANDNVVSIQLADLYEFPINFNDTIYSNDCCSKFLLTKVSFSNSNHILTADIEEPATILLSHFVGFTE